MAHSLLYFFVCIVVALLVLDHLTVFIANALHAPMCRLKIKRTFGTHNDPSNMDSLLLTLWYHSLDQITGLETKEAFLAGAMADRKPILGDSAHLTIAMPCCHDEQGLDTFDV